MRHFVLTSVLALPVLRRRVPVGLALTVSVGLASASAAVAQERYADVEYISGRAGMSTKVKGTLVIGDSLYFLKRDSTTAFSVPLSAITEVGNQTDIRDASVGKKLLFGGLSGSRKQDFVNVTYETAETAEGLVFKVKQGTATGIVAKLKFAMKKGKNGSVAVDSIAADTGKRGR